jgi:maleate isomerase
MTPHDMTLDQAPGVGVLVPPSNPVVEPELQRLLPETLRLHAARFPVMPGTTLQERNRRYLDHYETTQAAFGELDLAAIVVGLTGPSYHLLPEGDRALVARLSAVRPVQTASNAIALALAALGTRRICLISPYPAFLTEEAERYWSATGVEIVQLLRLDQAESPYKLTSADVLRAMGQIRHDAVDAVLMTGTGMVTLPAILASRGTGAKPFLSSNLCLAWWLMRQTGRHEAPAAFRGASPELLARLG